MAIIDVTQLLNLVSHSLKGSSGNKHCFQCLVFLWAFKSSGRKWTMKHLLPVERLPFTETTFLKGQQALAPSRYPRCFHTSFLQEPFLDTLMTERFWVFGERTCGMMDHHHKTHSFSTLQASNSMLCLAVNQYKQSILLQ